MAFLGMSGSTGVIAECVGGWLGVAVVGEAGRWWEGFPTC